MKSTDYKLVFALVLLLAGTARQAAAQCTTWLHPAPPATYNDMNNSFGGAPCDAGLGCPFNEIQAFEVFASEAYIASNFQAGGTYAFSICNGPGAGSWVPEFTILGPSGTVVAFGPGDGDGCTITFTAPVSGSYKFIINEAGNCPGGPNQAVGNGRPALRCISGADCSQATCKAGNLLSTVPVTVCGPGNVFNIGAFGTLQPANGGYGWYFTEGPGGTGGQAGGFFLSNVPVSGTNYDADLNGVLSGLSLPPLVGTWVVRGAAYTLADNPVGTFCSVTPDSLVVNFSPTPPPVVTVTDNGDGSATATATGGTGPYTYQWPDGSTGAGQTTATATGLSTGSYIVVVTDANGCAALGGVDVVSSVENVGELASLTILPNPTSGRFLVKIALRTLQNVEVNILDINGKLVASAMDNTADKGFAFDLSGKAAGVYLVRVKIGAGMVTKRLVLVK